MDQVERALRFMNELLRQIAVGVEANKFETFRLMVRLTLTNNELILEKKTDEKSTAVHQVPIQNSQPANNGHKGRGGAAVASLGVDSPPR